jgi:hypothetical protein
MTWSAIDFNGAGTRVARAIESPAASRATEWTSRVLLGIALDMIPSVVFMPHPTLVETTAVRDREATGPWVGLSLVRQAWAQDLG